MQGLHLTADLYQCACDDVLMLDAQAIAALCRRQTEDAGLTRVDDRWVQFPAWSSISQSPDQCDRYSRNWSVSVVSASICCA